MVRVRSDNVSLLDKPGTGLSPGKARGNDRGSLVASIVDQRTSGKMVKLSDMRTIGVSMTT
jgi:hypothetical protein